MQAREWMNRWMGAVGFATLLVAGCTPESTGGNLATMRVSVMRADAVPSAVVASQDLTAGAVNLSNVDSLSVTLDSVQVQTSSAEGWQTVIASLDLDLLKLSETDPIDLGSVTVQNGACEVRLFVSNPYIEFGQDVTVGHSTFSGGKPGHSFTIPSGPQTGLKAEGACDATDAAHVILTFDVSASVGTIVATGSGAIMLTPVIRVSQQP